MRKLAGVLLLLTMFSGCQCSGLTERYADCIDRKADNGFYLDHLYKAEHDLTRIGKPDWCCSDFNRSWCELGCGGNCGR